MPARPALLAALLIATASAPAAAAEDGSASPPAEHKKTIQEILAERDERKVIYAGLEKSETLSALLSVVPGFGAGCFYGGSSEMGWAFLGIEGGILLVTSLTASNLSLTAIQAEAYVFTLAKAAELVTCTLETSSFNDDLHRAYEMGNRRQGLTLAPGIDPSRPSIVAGYTFRF